MKKLIAIHEILRTVEGQRIAQVPGSKFTTSDEEAELLVEKFGAAKYAGKAAAEDEGGDTNGDDTGKKAKELSSMNKAELTAKAAELEVTVPEGSTNKQIVALIEAKLADGDLV